MERKYAFKGTFRTYQKRVLDNVDNLLDDKHLHIVAAPGSGKTILGLEVICRINKPALILAPTIAIRDQWVKRFKTFFTDEDVNQIVSKEFDNPKFLTVITYQGLHALMKKDVQSDSTIDAIFAKGIGTICLDEAHHLRNEWQKSLTLFLKKLKEASVLKEQLNYISLTATPPYDSTIEKWKKYIDTCGEIDEEITIPELVGRGDLCPHQDYVYINMPTLEEHNKLNSIWEAPIKAVNVLYENGLLSKLASEFNHNIDVIEELFEECLDKEELLLSFVVILKHYQIEVSETVEAILSSYFSLQNVFHSNTTFTTQSVEEAFTFILSTPDAFIKETYQKTIDIMTEYKVVRVHLGELKVVSNSEKRNKKIILASVGKLQSICDIVRSEQSVLNDKLRQVILTDNIYAKEVDKIGTDKVFTKIGAVPIFETVRRSLAIEGSTKHLALLTGTLVIVHQNSLDDIMKCGLLEFGDKWRSPSVTPIECGFVKLDFPKSTSQSVPTLTRAFNEGIIRIMVGTAALLGEGWDAPTINSLILASFVKTYMLSNQMRGRAIRRDPNDIDKVANIWHLLTLDNLKLYKESKEDAIINDHDIRALRKRTQSLYAIDARTLPYKYNAALHLMEQNKEWVHPELNNGLDRCFQVNLDTALEDYEATNKATLEISKSRDMLSQAWKDTINANSIDMTYEPQLKVEYKPKNTSSYIFDVKDIMLVIIVAVAFYILDITAIIPYYVRGSISTLEIIYSLVTVVVLINLFIIQMVIRFRRVRLFNSKIRYSRQSKALLKALQAAGLITSRNAKVLVKTEEIGATVSLVNATMAEKTIFSNCLIEFSLPPKNPRYLLVPTKKFGTFLPFFAQAVPHALSANKEIVNLYVEELNNAGLKVKAVYTRNSDGRKLLIRARKLALTNTISGNVTNIRT